MKLGCLVVSCFFVCIVATSSLSAMSSFVEEMAIDGVYGVAEPTNINDALYQELAQLNCFNEFSDVFIERISDSVIKAYRTKKLFLKGLILSREILSRIFTILSNNSVLLNEIEIVRCKLNGLPGSIKFFKNLNTLKIHDCALLQCIDLNLISGLKNLEVLSLDYSKEFLNKGLVVFSGKILLLKKLKTLTFFLCQDKLRFDLQKVVNNCFPKVKIEFI